MKASSTFAGCSAAGADCGGLITEVDCCAAIGRTRAATSRLLHKTNFWNDISILYSATMRRTRVRVGTSGRVPGVVGRNFRRPYGTRVVSAAFPGAEAPGYFRLPLRGMRTSLAARVAGRRRLSFAKVFPTAGFEFLLLAAFLNERNAGATSDVADALDRDPGDALRDGFSGGCGEQ